MGASPSHEVLKAFKDPANAAFDALDKDGDGHLSGEELIKFCDQCIRFLLKDLHDQPLSVELTVKGVLKTLTKQQFIDYILDVSEAKAGTSGNIRSLDWTEFQRFVLEHNHWEQFDLRKVEDELLRGDPHSAMGAPLLDGRDDYDQSTFNPRGDDVIVGGASPMDKDVAVGVYDRVADGIMVEDAKPDIK